MLDDIIEYEEQGMELEKEVKFMQKLINSGVVWKLQGCYGRRAMDMIEAGYCVLGKVGHKDAYGNYVPSRTEVKEGSKGSKTYCNKMEVK